MSPWGWQPERTLGIWRHGAGWLRPLVVASPWIAVGLLVLQIHLIGGTLMAEKGLLFDLPEEAIGDGEPTDLVALVMPTEHDTLVFFDDSRYQMSDPTSVNALREHLSERLAFSNRKSVLALADRRVSNGELMKFGGIVRKSGAVKLLLAEKKGESEP